MLFGIKLERGSPCNRVFVLWCLCNLTSRFVGFLQSLFMCPSMAQRQFPIFCMTYTIYATLQNQFSFCDRTQTLVGKLDVKKKKEQQIKTHVGVYMLLPFSSGRIEFGGFAVDKALLDVCYLKAEDNWVFLHIDSYCIQSQHTQPTSKICQRYNLSHKVF